MTAPVSSSHARGPSAISTWVLAARPKTLLAAVSPVLLGTAVATAHGLLHVPSAVLALVGAILIQVATNYSNDYHDFVKGADTDARKGPLRATQAGLVSPRAMRRAAFTAFAMAVLAGAYLIWRGGLPVLAIGVLSIASGIWYTAGRYSLAYLGLADLFVLVFFGPVAVGGTYYVQALSISPAVVLAGVGPGALAVAILLINNIRDIDEDRAAGKKTLVVRMGRPAGIRFYVIMLLLAAVIPAGLAIAAAAPVPVVAAALIPALAWPVVRTLRRGRDAGELNPLLGQTSRLLFLYSIVMGVGWMIG